MTATATPPPRTRRAVTLADGVVLAGVACLLTFPVLARVAADRLPIGPPAALPALPAHVRAASLRELPAGLRPGPAAVRAEDLRPAAAGLLGERSAERLLAFVSAPTFEAPRGNGTPYRYRQLDRFLPPAFTPAQVPAATDLGARLMLLRGRYIGADAAAYALLDRARGGGACAPSLDVLLLVASDRGPDLRIIKAEAERANRACPGDPTALWLLGQVQSQLAVTDPGDRAALTTFRRLERRLPGSAAAWSGEADAYVRIASAVPPEQAFVIRHLYERALARYRRAQALRPDPELEAGVAVALAGVGSHREAVAVQERVVAARPSSPLMSRRLVGALEADHRFAAEARAAARLLALGRPPLPGPGRFPALRVPADAQHRDLAGLLSLGAGRLIPLHVNLFPPPYGDVEAGQSVIDTSFIPVFRPEQEVTRVEDWCVRGALRRAQLLSGSPRPALDGASSACDTGGPDALPAIAELELGDRRAAQAAIARAAAAAAVTAPSVDDLRQNLWRWAGDFARAEAAVREWMRVDRGPLPLLRLGEIEYLRRRYDLAASDFGASARRARDRAATWSLAEAQATLDRGAALDAARRKGEATAALRAADDIASRAGALAPDPQSERAIELAAVSGYARFRLADSEREAHALPAAADDYAAARERALGVVSEAALNNNAAIVDIALHRGEDALQATRRARRVDPESPVYLMTAAAAAASGGHTALAIRLAGATLAADPSSFPAANDLGVLLARRGDEQRAVAALRRAVGAYPRYALGWFNLGVVLAGMGPRHLFASQGALARAFTLDPALRDRKRVPTTDDRTFRSGLDVSRPLPAKWSFASSQPQAPARTAGLAALLLGIFALSRVLTASGSGRGLAETWLGPIDRASRRLGRRVRHPAIAVAATLAVFAWPLVRDPGGGLTAAVAGGLGIVVLVALVARSRILDAARPAQQTWAPGVILGLGAAAGGFTWAPLPVLDEEASPRQHWAAPVALAVVALPLVALTVWADIPLTRSLAAAALVMAASLLTPVKPVDGGAIATAGGTAAGLVGIALALLLALGLV